VKKGGVTSSLSDVGFGISQFLPIIVADLQLPDTSTLFVAQPEIHLHPSVQSSFGDYLANQINTTNKNYVIETHSEYLLNKIRLAIVKGELNEEDVNVGFTDNDDNENVVHKISFTPRGQILNAPKNFFKTYMMDVMEIAINAAD
jgi:predicted ATPase